VLTTPLIESFLAYQRESGVGLEQLGTAMLRAAEESGHHPLYELEKGRISEREFLSLLEGQLGDGIKLHGFRDTYFRHLRPNARMIGYVRELRGRGLRTALLTNNVREWEPQWRAKLPDVDEIFEVIVDSAYVGMRKPERGIYELTLERLGGSLRADECVFVDDIDANCDAAEELGMVAVRFQDAEQAIGEIERALAERAEAS
jgi:putative hydrolase of the HAD superfamily